MEVEAAPRKESFSTIPTEIQSLELNAVKIGKESIKTLLANQVKTSNVVEFMCLFTV